MANLTNAQLLTKYNDSGTGLFKDNTNKEIVPSRPRSLVTDLTDSVFNKNNDAYTGAKGQRAGITAPASLKDIVTVGLPYTTLVTFVDTTADNIVRIYELSNETTAETSPFVIRPNDYATTTNETVWRLRSEGTSREFDRTFVTELQFDKNMIEAALHVQTDDITFTVAEAGNLVNQESIYGQRITTDGVHPIYFDTATFKHVANIANGEILEAGTYQFIFWYSNGIARASVMLPSEEVVTLQPLSTPTSFVAVPGAGDPEDDIDLSWVDVSNESSYELDYSLTGAAPWTAITPSPVAGATTYTHTGLSANTQYFYRLRAIGDGVTFSNSNYATANSTTEDAGDVTPPTFTFSPADAATDIPVNGVVTITCSEPIRDTDGVTEITDANITDYLVVKVDNGAGADIPYIATIDAGKTIITITPNVVWPSLDNVFIQISGVEDVNGNAAVTDDATFATNDYTLSNNNYLNLGDILDSVIAVNDANFDFEFTAKDINPAVDTFLFRKYATGQRSFLYNLFGGDFTFKFYEGGATEPHVDDRLISWAAPGFSGEHTWTLEYRGAIDTNDGLDRLTLKKDGVTVGSKTLTVGGGAPFPWPFSIRSVAANLLIGPTHALLKDILIKSNNGATTEVSIPVVRSGLDVSGNARHGTWS